MASVTETKRWHCLVQKCAAVANLSTSLALEMVSSTFQPAGKPLTCEKLPPDILPGSNKAPFKYLQQKCSKQASYSSTIFLPAIPIYKSNKRQEDVLYQKYHHSQWFKSTPTCQIFHRSKAQHIRVMYSITYDTGSYYLSQGQINKIHKYS